MIRRMLLNKVWRAVAVAGLILPGLVSVLGGSPARPVARAETSTFVYLPVVQLKNPPVTVFGAEMAPITNIGGLAQMQETDMGWVRRAGVEWRSVESVKGVYNWSVLSGLEQELINAHASGIQVIMIVRGTPDWAQAKPGHACGPIKDTEFGTFAAFMNALVNRYRLAPYAVKYWEIWNEPDIAPELVASDSPWGCWGDRADPYYGGGYYADMLKVVYPQIKLADPAAKVLLGGLLLDCDHRIAGACAGSWDGDTPPKFFEGILLNGGGPFFDGVSFHAYDYYGGQLGSYSHGGWQTSSSTTGPVLIAKSNYLTSLMAAYGVTGKFLMNTESAMVTDATADANFETTKANYVAQVYAAALAQGLRANLWFSVLGWRNSGLLDGSLNPKAAYTAYQFASLKLRNAVFTEAVTGYSGVMGYKFDRGDREIWVIWALSASADVTLPGTPLAVYDAMGSSQTASTTITVTQTPLFVEWNP